ncbi:hypothetical protein CCACVL1_11868, partial [Corchorus capsularis]
EARVQLVLASRLALMQWPA